MDRPPRERVALTLELTEVEPSGVVDPAARASRPPQRGSDISPTLTTMVQRSERDSGMEHRRIISRSSSLASNNELDTPTYAPPGSFL